MHLSREEELILSGERGVAKATALKTIVKVGEALGAEKLIDIKHAHVSGVSYFNIGDAGLMLLDELLNYNAKFSVFTTANPYAAVYAKYEGLGFDNSVIRKQEKIIRAIAKMGAKAFTCAPYYIRRPNKDEHLAWAESNAVLYANSIAGARTNREGGPLSLMAAIIGKTYYAGVHIFENRVPKYLVRTDKANNISELAAIGYLLGIMHPSGIIYLMGIGMKDEYYLRTLLAAYGATSGSPMIVIEGITPDYKLLREKADIVDVKFLSRGEVASFLKESAAERKTDKVLYILGCPHLSIHELTSIIDYLKANLSKKPSNKELWLFTYSGAISKELVDRLEKFGVKIYFNSCPIVTKLVNIGVKHVVTDSAKAFHYLPRLAGVKSYIMERRKILKEFIGEQ